MRETPPAHPYTPTQLTSWCPGSWAPPCPSQGASTPSRSLVVDPVLPTIFGQIPILYHQTPCTTTLTSIPPPMNTTLGPRPGHHPTLYPVLGDTRTITTWTQLQLTCTQPPVDPLTMTMGPDNDCCQPGLMAALWEWKQARKAAQSHLLRPSATCAVCSGAETLLDKSCRIYLKEMHLNGKHGHMLWAPKGVLTWTLARALHQGTSYLSSADIEPAKSGDRKDLSLTRTIPLITDWNLILSSFLCWMHFLICLVFIAFKKAICYIVHQPSR